MKVIMKIVSFVALALTLCPAFLVLTGTIDDAAYKSLMLTGTIVWFVTAPFWIFKDNSTQDA